MKQLSPMKRRSKEKKTRQGYRVSFGKEKSEKLIPMIEKTKKNKKEIEKRATETRDRYRKEVGICMHEVVKAVPTARPEKNVVEE